LYVDFLLDYAVEEHGLNVNVMDLLAFTHRQCHHHATRLQARHQCKDIVEVDAGALDVALGHQTHLVSYDIADFIAFTLDTHFRSIAWWPTGSEVSSQVSLSSIAFISSCIATCQAVSFSTSLNDACSSAKVKLSSIFSTRRVSPVGSASLIESLMAWTRSGASSWSALRSSLLISCSCPWLRVLPHRR
jgi:hypothetical protein